MLNAILTAEMAYLAFDALMEVSRWFSPLTGPQYTNQTQITVIRGAAGSRCFGRIRIRVLMKEKKTRVYSEGSDLDVLIGFGSVHWRRKKLESGFGFSLIIQTQDKTFLSNDQRNDNTNLLNLNWKGKNANFDRSEFVSFAPNHFNLIYFVFSWRGQGLGQTNYKLIYKKGLFLYLNIEMKGNGYLQFLTYKMILTINFWFYNDSLILIV